MWYRNQVTHSLYRSTTFTGTASVFGAAGIPDGYEAYYPYNYVRQNGTDIFVAYKNTTTDMPDLSCSAGKENDEF